MLRDLSAAALLAVGLVTIACSQPAAPTASPGTSGATIGSLDVKGGRAGSIGAVFVSGQGLYYDTFVVTDPLPMEGRFQRLENGVTEFGPGDRQYLGGRWWEDLNHNGVQDEGDHFFLCPLLPPGRTTK